MISNVNKTEFQINEKTCQFLYADSYLKTLPVPIYYSVDIIPLQNVTSSLFSPFVNPTLQEILHTVV